MLHDPEEEHDCFSDNTHNSHYYDALGIANVYLGRYQRVDGSTVEGPSLADLVAGDGPGARREMRAKLDATLAAMQAIKDKADSGEMAYDQMIGEGNPEGNAMVQAAIDALLDADQGDRAGRRGARSGPARRSRAPTASTIRRRCSSRVECDAFGCGARDRRCGSA